ncbi:unnamed protein product [Ostreobium quekettii]|uniref:Uncharacterized protein n=1 Tax=Ostreobium quekettii TaxID=121088 RepID=A0A8S1IZI1_9CHLO|nr:unnamed protein product [Ostreobium quekettii]
MRAWKSVDCCCYSVELTANTPVGNQSGIKTAVVQLVSVQCTDTLAQRQSILLTLVQLTAETEHRRDLQKAMDKEREQRLAPGKEDMETLLLALREIASAPQCREAVSSNIAKRVSEAARRVEGDDTDDGTGCTSDVEQMKQEFLEQQSRMTEDGRRLRAELDATKQMLTRALKCESKSKAGKAVSLL